MSGVCVCTCVWGRGREGGRKGRGKEGERGVRGVCILVYACTCVGEGEGGRERCERCVYVCLCMHAYV